MTDDQYRILAARFLQEAMYTKNKRTGYRSFRAWLKNNGYPAPGTDRGLRILKSLKAARIRTNTWESPGPDGPVQLNQVRIDWDSVESDLRASILDFIRREVEPVRIKPARLGNKLGVLSIPDIHVGKLAWGDEVGSSYDTKIAVAVYRDAASHLIGELRRNDVGEVVYVVGNDLLHVDGFDNATTAGTPQDTDTRFQKAFLRAKDMIVATACALAEFAHVHLVVQPGNHDRILSWTLGEVLAAYFKDSKAVKVDNAPAYRRYVQKGRILFGITHGDKVKPTDLPSIMATEAPDSWGSTVYREWFLGHRHRKQEFTTLSITEQGGVRIRFLPSLAGQDRWHFERGYYNVRSAEAHVYAPEKGHQLMSFYYHL